MATETNTELLKILEACGNTKASCPTNVLMHPEPEAGEAELKESLDACYVVHGICEALLTRILDAAIMHGKAALDETDSTRKAEIEPILAELAVGMKSMKNTLVRLTTDINKIENDKDGDVYGKCFKLMGICGELHQWTDSAESLTAPLLARL